MDKLNPNALAESGDADLDDRPGVQPVDAQMILDHIIAAEELPPYSARPFADWLHDAWFNFSEDGNLTNGDVIAGALADWRGGK